MEILNAVLPFLPAVIAVVVVIVLACVCYKVARAEQALVVSGGKKLKIRPGGGSIVIPIIRKYQYFDLCVRTISSDDDEIKTKTLVPIIVRWTAQIRPSTDLEQLECAVRSFSERSDEDIVRDLKLTLDGAVREVVAKMTPEQVSSDKETFSRAILDSVKPELEGFGMDLVSLNIQDVTDKHSYFDNLSAKDSELRRQEAEEVKADADRAVRERKAEAERIAKQAELDSVKSINEREAETNRISAEARLVSDQAIAEKTRDVEVAKATFRAEQETAAANADIAKDLQTAIRERELAEKKGSIVVMEREQENLAAKKQQEVAITEAETAKKKLVIESEADKERTVINATASSEKQQIDAKAAAEVAKTKAEGEARKAELEAEGKANALKKESDGEAEAKRLVAKGEADAIKAKAEAEATQIERTGTAQAEITEKTGQAEAAAIKAKGLAEAEAIKAKGLAEAEAESAKADALAKHEGVNLQVAIAEIFKDMQVEISTNIGTVMAKVGENTTIYDFGGGAKSSGATSSLTNFIGDFPRLMKESNLLNTALNGEDFNETVAGFMGSIFGPMGALNKETKVISSDLLEDGSKASEDDLDTTDKTDESASE